MEREVEEKHTSVAEDVVDIAIISEKDIVLHAGSGARNVYEGTRGKTKKRTELGYRTDNPFIR